MAGNSLSLDAIMYLRQLIGLRGISMQQYMHAARLRAAHSTLNSIDARWKTLYGADIGLSVLRTVGWDSPSFVENLRDSPQWLHKPRLSLQALYMEALIAHSVARDTFRQAWFKILGKRLPVLCCGGAFVTDSALTGSLQPRLSALGSSPCMIVVKTLANSWATSSRCHEAFQSTCLLGCDYCHPLFGSRPSDSLAHYLSCPILWRFVKAASGLWPGDCAAHRCGISGRAIDPRLLSVAHITYHHLKHHGLGHIHGHISYRDPAKKSMILPFVLLVQPLIFVPLVLDET